MEFRIADTFTDSLVKLTGQEQKAVKTTAFDLQLNPANPGMRFHKLDRAKDPNFWSVSVNMDIRLIVHRTDTSLLLCYVAHHDDAYTWASRRKIERHPKTGAAQLVEIRETIEEVVIQQPIHKPAAIAPKPLLFADISDDELLSYGIPPEWLKDVKQATEDTLFDIADRLPQEATEALLELATGGKPQRPIPVPGDINPFDHPDAQRRFRVMNNMAELERALAYPWEKWTVFLHPGQRSLVERDYSGPARISGSAGTGKTIVGLHRAVFLARQHPTAQLLLTTFSPALANVLRIKLHRLASNEPDPINRIRVGGIQEVVQELYTNAFGIPHLADPSKVRSQLIKIAKQVPDLHFTESFLWGEWNNVVDAWQLDTWEAYRDVPRLGRKTRLGEKQRKLFWQVFQQLLTWLDQQQLLTWSSLFGRITQHLIDTGESPFEFAIVDEAQDMGIAELRFLVAIGKQRPDSLFFTGDLGQRIFQQPFSWKSLGVDIRGRAQTLTINYRTSHQIRSSADRLLPTEIADVDGNLEQRRGTVSVFDGPMPVIEIYDNPETEIEAVGEWIADRLTSGIQPEEIGVFVRDHPQIERAIAAITQAGATPVELDDQISFAEGCIAVSTMHLAKGLEFRVVVVMACDDEVIPLQERIESIADESDLEEVYNTERHLLYVACTRARDDLLISGVDPASEFLDDLIGVKVAMRCSKSSVRRLKTMLVEG
ncbi:3'-5' exonuclease [Leptolyngbya sp. ST-U4]|uniref:3'-5' exonuclease n=1 Tax=Leptolyngbya sp. ST-U4 TaxID=2933912 RepID=UPI003296BED8